jgi:hypothetical protein
MKRVLLVLLAASGLIASGAGTAAKVNMPKEGSYEFEFCSIGRFKTMSSGDDVFVSHYDVVANLRTSPPGRPFDRAAAQCYGVYARLNGQHQESGVCELTDEDNDKWWMSYRGNADGSGGTYNAVHGTGKYAGMNLRGEYHLDFWPAVSKDVVQACNKNKGSYKLR